MLWEQLNPRPSGPVADFRNDPEFKKSLEKHRKFVYLIYIKYNYVCVFNNTKNIMLSSQSNAENSEQVSKLNDEGLNDTTPETKLISKLAMLVLSVHYEPLNNDWP